MPRRFLVACFEEEESLLNAVRTVRGNGVKVYDVFAPYPIHQLGVAMEIRKSRLPLATLFGALTGLLVAIGLQFYANVLDWPMNVGGKPDNSTLAFIPITKGECGIVRLSADIHRPVQNICIKLKADCHQQAGERSE